MLDFWTFDTGTRAPEWADAEPAQPSTLPNLASGLVWPSVQILQLTWQDDVHDGGFLTTGIDGYYGSDTLILDFSGDFGGLTATGISFTGLASYTTKEVVTLSDGQVLSFDVLNFEIYDITASDGADMVVTEGGDDILRGGDGADHLDGAGGNDTLFGGAGDDALFGGSGNDRLIAGTGEDVLTGGAGADTFVFAVDGATKRITDFEAGDTIEVTGFATGFDISDVQWFDQDTVISGTRATNANRSVTEITATQVGDDVHVHFGGSDKLFSLIDTPMATLTLIFEGATSSDLSFDDFLLL
ncbi:MAG: calcium-binding protein [Pseudomonadota bacterium]